MTDVLVAPAPVSDPFRPLRYRIARRRPLTGDVTALFLEPAGAVIAEPAPGQFTMLWCPGVGEIPLSTYGRPSDDEYLVHAIRAVGPVSGALCARPLGAVIGVRGPFGRGWDLDALAGRDVLLVAGGMGFAPLRPVVQSLLRARDQYGTIALVVGARTPEDLLDRAELDGWRARRDVAVEVTVDRAPAGWRGDVGVVTSLLRRVSFDPARAAALVCGPEVMIRHTAHRLLDAGVAAAAVQVSLERNMQCAIRRCGHCQLGPLFVCAEGPVVPWSVVGPLLEVPHL